MTNINCYVIDLTQTVFESTDLPKWETDAQLIRPAHLVPVEWTVQSQTSDLRALNLLSDTTWPWGCPDTVADLTWKALLFSVITSCHSVMEMYWLSCCWIYNVISSVTVLWVCSATIQQSFWYGLYRDVMALHCHKALPIRVCMAYELLLLVCTLSRQHPSNTCQYPSWYALYQALWDCTVTSERHPDISYKKTPWESTVRRQYPSWCSPDQGLVEVHCHKYQMSSVCRSIYIYIYMSFMNLTWVHPGKS